MNYHEILLVPATGHFGPGAFDPGPNYGHYFEMDIARQLIETLADRLDNDRVRVRVAAIFDPPGQTRDQIAAETFENTLSLHVSFGRGEVKDEAKNATRAWFSRSSASFLAKILCESAADWAKCSNFNHVLTQPKLREGFFPHDAILIEPFKLACPEPEAYLRRMKDLAQALSQTIVDFLARTGSAMRVTPYQSLAQEKKPVDAGLVSQLLSVAEGWETPTSQPPGKPQSPQSGDNGRRAAPGKAARQS